MSRLLTFRMAPPLIVLSIEDDKKGRDNREG